jgi:hypothetical protein
MRKPVPARLLLAGALAVAAAALAALPPWTAASASPDGSGEADKPIQDLIRQLGDDDPKVREEATRRLKELDAAEPALRKALASTDPEVVRRARDILETLQERRLKRALARIQAAAKEGEADLLAERLVRWQGPNDEAGCWQALMDLSWGLLERDHKEFKRTAVLKEDRMAPRDFRKHAEKKYVKILPAGRPDVEVPRARVREGEWGMFVARGERVVIGAKAMSNLVAASGPARFAELGRSLVLAGGSVEATGEVRGCVIVCDGDFEAKECLTNSIVVARGSVRCPVQQVAGSVILAGGEVRIPKRAQVGNCTIRSMGAVTFAERGKFDVIDCEIKERDPDALSAVTFFEPKRVGVEAAQAEGGVQVEKAAKGKPFAAAGVQEGDLLLAVSGEKITSLEAFRRLLRRAVAEGQTIVRLRRGKEEREVAVSFPE